MNIERISLGPDPPAVVHAVVVTPRGSRYEYAYDFELEIFRLNQVLYSSLSYPVARGFIPQTLAADGRPLEILVATAEPTFSGCLIEARPVGLVRLVDEDSRQDLVLAVPEGDPRFLKVADLGALPSFLLREIEQFFTAAKVLEGRTLDGLAWRDRSSAAQAIREAVAN